MSTEDYQENLSIRTFTYQKKLISYWHANERINHTVAQKNWTGSFLASGEMSGLLQAPEQLVF